MKRKYILSILIIFTTTFSYSQSIVDSLQTRIDGQGIITIKQDEKVKELMNRYKFEKTNNLEVAGYRVQVYLGSNSRQSKEESQRIASRIKNKYPELKVYSIFKKPRWICLVGDYRNIEEAEKVMRLLKKEGFKESSIIRDKIKINIK